MQRLFPLTVCIFLFTSTFSAFGEENIFDFFAEEAKVVTASRQPTTLKNAPATVYVVTAEDIATSGGNTLWDALRGLPGVDVMTTRTWHAEVSMRGLNRPLNNRVLILLDGKTVLNGFFDFVTWESIPVVLEEIDRIEVVLGPASALYGANAIQGVVNIITKTPAQIRGLQAGYAIGEHQTHLSHVLYGKRAGKQAYKLSGAWRHGNAFETPDMQSSQVFKANGLWEYNWQSDARIEVSGGISDHNTHIVAAGAAGSAFDDGKNGYVKFTAQHTSTLFRAFWNRGRLSLRDFANFNDPNIDYDTFDFALEHSLRLPAKNQLVLGGHYRRNNMRSKIFGTRQISQDLWAIFFENVWSPDPHIDLTLSGRLDHHPLTGTVFSPRGSLTLKPHAQHTLRATAGTAFRYPTITENHIDFVDRIENDGSLAPNPPIEAFEIKFNGNPNLKAENLIFYEGAYTAQFGLLRTSLAGFYYRLKDLVTAGNLEDIELDFPVIRVNNTFSNAGEISAWGGEMGVEVRPHPGWHLYANYALVEFSDEFNEDFAADEGGPRHKINGGLKAKKGNWLFNTSAHWVDSTTWDSSPLPDSENQQVDAYYLINAHLGYEFSGAWNGLKIGINAFNLTNHRHAQILPQQPNGDPGQSGEILGRRLMLHLTYRY